MTLTLEREASQLHSVDEPPMLEQSSNWSNLLAGGNFAEPSSPKTRMLPLRRNAYAEVEKINGWRHTSAFPFF